MTTMPVRMHTIRRVAATRASLSLVTLLITAAFSPAAAQDAPTLGTAQTFAVLGGQTVTNTGPTIITGNVGVSPGTSVTGFPPGTVTGGTIHGPDAVTDQAQSDTTSAYDALAAQACTATYDVPTDLGGLTLAPGVYCFASSAGLTGALTLNAGGNVNAVWVFKTVSTLITASGSTVQVINGGQQCNVYWQVGSSATIGTSSTFVGTIVALTSITLNNSAKVSGRVLARNGAVTMDTNTIAISSCAVTPELIPPTLGKAFSPAAILAGGTSTLTITLGNADGTIASSASFTDTLPAGMVVAGSAVSTCGGTVSAAGSAITLTGGSIAARGSCTVAVDVTAADGGNYINSLAAGALQTSNGSNAAPAVATLSVVEPSVAPTLGKAFSPATIVAGGSSTLTIVLVNGSASPAALTSALIDALPSGMAVAAGAPRTNTCGGALTADTGSSTVTLTGGSIDANSSCTVSVRVTAAVAGSYFNSLIAGALQTSNGANAHPAVATLTVLESSVAPTLAKAFNPASLNEGEISTLTITLTNPNGAAATAASVTDTLPAGMAVAGTASSTCGGTLTVDGSTVNLTGGSIPATGSCAVTVPVTAAVAGSYLNVLAVGALQTSKGSNAAAASATLSVLPVTTRPGLSLTKTASRTTYTSKGQVIVYTYVLRNAGNVPLAGPFTITDDKLGSFTCGDAVSLIPGASVTCTKSYTVKASDLGTVPSLPTGVVANIYTDGWLAGGVSTQYSKITGAGLAVPNGVYPAWCIQDSVPTDLRNQPGTLYSTIGSGLPADVAGLAWGKVNYVLNHRIRRPGSSQLTFTKDVQSAIWVLLGEPNPLFGVSATAQLMIDAANAHADFVPGPDDVVAVLIYSDGMRITPGSIQENIVEMIRFKTIVNRATGSGTFDGTAVRSSEAQATVTQVRR